MDEGRVTATHCAGHEYLVREIESGFKRIGEKVDDLGREMGRRMDESADDRALLHEQHNSLAREVTAAMTRLNGATLFKGHPHHRCSDDGETDSLHVRKSDSFTGWVRENWIVLTAIVTAAFAGEKVIPKILEVGGRLMGIIK